MCVCVCVCVCVEVCVCVCRGEHRPEQTQCVSVCVHVSVCRGSTGQDGLGILNLQTEDLA